MNLNESEKFLQSNFELDILLSNARDLVRLTKEEFINRLIACVGDESKNKLKKDNLNMLRLQLAFRILTKYQVKKDIQIQNRTKAKQMATDIWLLLISFVDERLNVECNEIVFLNPKSKNNNLNVTTDITNQVNDAVVSDEANSDIKQILSRIYKEMTELKESNLKILETVSTLKEENIQLKKMFNKMNKLSNFNLLNHDETIDNLIEDNDEVFEPQFVQQGTKKINVSNEIKRKDVSYSGVVKNSRSKFSENNQNEKRKKFVVGALKSTTLGAATKPAKPVKLFDYYTGFWSLSSDESSVNEYISKFDAVEYIKELRTKGDYYKSFHFKVNSNLMEEVLNPDNWADGIRVKRYFEAKVIRNYANEGPRYQRDNVEKSSHDGYSTNYNNRGAFSGGGRGRATAARGGYRQQNGVRNNSKRNRSVDREDTDEDNDDFSNKKHQQAIMSNNSSTIIVDNSMDHETNKL
ncbi:unnamed protein product [Brachionus calyciflorus]|uniref:Uncharacterized protein n=1 Tax=Brachionus calyciflorus TaxID=104777 RepID=A0A814HC94_9BILA|nr:unnamed protein product [Brachionus calyciflorus]